MEFLRALEKAKELGLTKEDFLPIYLQEVAEKASKLSQQNLERKSSLQSDGAAQSVSSKTSELPINRQEWRPWQQPAQMQSPEPTEISVYDLKASLDNINKSLQQQLMNFRQENVKENAHLMHVQEDIKNCITEIHNNIQALLQIQQIGDLDQGADRKSVPILSSFLKEIIQNYEEHALKLKTEIEHSKEEILTECYILNNNQDITQSNRSQEQEELIRIQGSLAQNSHLKLELAFQQWQTELKSLVNNMSNLVLAVFNKTCEFQNVFSAEMYQQKNSQQLLFVNSGYLVSATKEITSLLNMLNNSKENIEKENQEHCFDSVDYTGDMLYATEIGGCNNKTTKNNSINLFAHPLQSGAGDLKPFEEIKYDSLTYPEFVGKDSHTSVDNRIVSVFESDAASSDDIVSFIYDFYVKNMSSFLESKREFQKVTYDGNLGCCLRASIYFSNEPHENILQMSLDMCQVGRDVTLPDILRIASEIRLFDRSGVYSSWIVGREKGVFHLPRIKENGWFEVCVAFLDFDHPKFAEFIQNGELSFFFQATVFNRKVNSLPEPDSYLPHDLQQQNSVNSNSDVSEYFDMSFDNSKEAENLMSVSESSEISPASEIMEDLKYLPSLLAAAPASKIKEDLHPASASEVFPVSEITGSIIDSFSPLEIVLTSEAKKDLMSFSLSETADTSDEIKNLKLYSPSEIVHVAEAIENSKSFSQKEIALPTSQELENLKSSSPSEIVPPRSIEIEDSQLFSSTELTSLLSEERQDPETFSQSEVISPISKEIAELKSFSLSEIATTVETEELESFSPSEIIPTSEEIGRDSKSCLLSELAPESDENGYSELFSPSEIAPTSEEINNFKFCSSPELVVTAEVTEDLMSLSPSEIAPTSEEINDFKFCSSPELVVTAEVIEDLKSLSPSEMAPTSEKIKDFKFCSSPELVVTAEVIEDLKSLSSSEIVPTSEEINDFKFCSSPELVITAKVIDNLKSLSPSEINPASEFKDDSKPFSPSEIALTSEVIVDLGSASLSPEIAPKLEVTAHKSWQQQGSLENGGRDIIQLPPHSTYFFSVCDFHSLVTSETVVDSQDWYIDFLGHCIHAVLAFLDDDLMMVCLDYFHGVCNDNLPDFAAFRCVVSIMDQTNQMEDLVLGDSIQVFDLTKATAADWMENCVCMINCNTIGDRFKNSDRIVLQFDFFEME